MIQKATKTNRVPKLIMLNEVTKKELTMQAIHYGKSLQVYIEQILTQAAERAEEQILLELAEQGDQEIIKGVEKQEFEKYIQLLVQ